jgi:hypothetical protein
MPEATRALTSGDYREPRPISYGRTVSLFRQTINSVAPVVSYRHDTATHRCQRPKSALWSCGWNYSAWFCIHRVDSVKTAVPVCFAYDRIRRLCDHSSFGELHTPKSHDSRSQHQLLYSGWTAMALYVNINAGVGKPLWEITLGEFVVWFKVRVASSVPMAPRS